MNERTDGRHVLLVQQHKIRHASLVRKQAAVSIHALVNHAIMKADLKIEKTTVVFRDALAYPIHKKRSGFTDLAFNRSFLDFHNANKTTKMDVQKNVFKHNIASKKQNTIKLFAKSTRFSIFFDRAEKESKNNIEKPIKNHAFHLQNTIKFFHF